MTDIHPNLLHKPSTNPSHAIVSKHRAQHRPTLDLLTLFPEYDGHAVLSKRIKEPTDVHFWLHSEAFVRILCFLQTVNSSCTKLTCTQARELFGEFENQERFRKLIAVFEAMERMISETPLEPLQGRYGNKAFRTFKEKLTTESMALHQAFLSDLDFPTPCLEELIVYFNDAFGNATRIDYGTGHEMAFICWLTCLDLLNVFGSENQTSYYSYLGLVIFEKYLSVVRRLQTFFSLEPAGSHGVWGLDDYQFIPYYWGAAQLIDHPHFKPSVVTNLEIIQHYSYDYLYFQVIEEVYKNKMGPFFEHSPMLYDISGVPSWHKVNSGMLKMYIAEVCQKFPIVQHVFFGALLPYRQMDPDPLPSNVNDVTSIMT